MPITRHVWSHAHIHTCITSFTTAHKCLHTLIVYTALYPFGYGLSYTTFHLTLADPRDQHSFPANEEVIIDLESGREGKGEERVESDAPAFTAQFSCDDDDDTKVESVTAYVTNTGSMDGDEVRFNFDFVFACMRVR